MKCWVITNPWKQTMCKRRAKWWVRDRPLCRVHGKLNSLLVQMYGRVPIKKEGATAP